MQLLREATPLLCECGHSVFCQLRRHGERLGTMAFFDDEETSAVYGERIERCPGCGVRLGIHRLVPRLSKGFQRLGEVQGEINPSSGGSLSLWELRV
jgi:hypothetical protein